ncbi:GntR family transcriptional regulator [Mesomycoplasma lagogenitalium]|uniref:GntR family transcriptional regulator n=1 Tax=Mesomycoplasma lagogenitalium TaxID=171286 RepID=A0ABY8LWT1_9BACT|nr:GntR family transcriptional regulator [Mesomycoplasma lagogenitalium]WGI36768.1 GntR family transcriptional regulator [Mesomycoplasma lagogenitalium]
MKDKKRILRTKKMKIIHYLLKVIASGEYKKNQIMPSEHFLMQKFDVSRITAINAYQQLEGMNAIYTIDKLGRYVSENFSGLAKSYSSLIDYKYSTMEKIDINDEIKWMKDYGVIFGDKINYYKKQYYNDKNEVIMVADHYVSEEYEIPLLENETFSIWEYLLKKTDAIKKIAYKLTNEKIENPWNLEFVPIVYAWSYNELGKKIASRYVVHPSYFVFSHEEKNVY